jgi:hypothetical protein
VGKPLLRGGVERRAFGLAVLIRQFLLSQCVRSHDSTCSPQFDFSARVRKMSWTVCAVYVVLLLLETCEAFILKSSNSFYLFIFEDSLKQHTYQ